MDRRNWLTFGGSALAGGLIRPALWASPGGKQGLSLFQVRDFGATGNGRTLDTRSLNAAIEACHAAGGGMVYVPPGVYLSGTVVLRSNVTLYLEAGATLLGSKDVQDYSPQPGPPAHGDANQKHLIFARDAQNIGLAGPGRIDGQGPAFWIPSGRRKPAPQDGWRDVATYDWKPLDRPSPLLEFVGCRHLRIEGVRIENAPGWTLRPINCDNVVIHGVAIKNPVIGPNTDGIDLTGCQNVFISDCHIDTGDDAICLKSENPYGTEARLSRNITITNCVLTSCCNGLKFGTATWGAFENITFSNCVIANENVALNARVIAGIALEMVDGGRLEGVVISNIRMQRVRTPIFLRRGIRHQTPDGSAGSLRGVMIENVHATGSILTSSVTGLHGFDVEDVTLAGIHIESDEAGLEEWVNREIPEIPQAYPEARMFGRLSSYGFYCRHVTGLRMRDITLAGAPGEKRPALVCDDVKGLDVSGLRTVSVAGRQPVVKLIHTRGAWLRDCAAPKGAQVFLRLEGERTGEIAVSNCDLRGAKRPIEMGPDVPAGAAVLAGSFGIEPAAGQG